MFSERQSFSLRWANFRALSQFLGQGNDFWFIQQPSSSPRVERAHFLAPQLLAALGWEKSCNTHLLQKLLFAPHCVCRAICSYHPWLFSSLRKHKHILGIKVTELWLELCHPDLPMVDFFLSSIFWIFHMNFERNSWTLVPESRNHHRYLAEANSRTENLIRNTPGFCPPERLWAWLPFHSLHERTQRGWATFHEHLPVLWSSVWKDNVFISFSEALTQCWTTEWGDK